MTYRTAMPLAELWDGEMQACRIDGRPVLLLKLDGRVCAYADRCAHQGVPLSEGELADGVLTCRAHHWQYDASSGRGINPAAARLQAYPVRIEDGAILIEVDAT
jgi:toluene monooxygenase system ferredoxin subunit